MKPLLRGGYFEIDDRSHQKGAYDIDVNPDNEKVGVYRLSSNGARTYIVDPVIFSDWTNSSDTPYASYSALINDFKASFFLTKSGGGSPVGNIETLSTAETEVYKVLKPDGVGGVGWQDGLQNIVIVNQDNVASTLGGTINSDKEYFIDGVIDMTGVSVEIPSSGLEMRGYSFDTSRFNLFRIKL